MKGYMICVLAFVILGLLVPSVTSSRRNIAVHRGRPRMRAAKENIYTPARTINGMRSNNNKGGDGKSERVELVAGSRLPDCSHACGSCSPCTLVMVSFVCATLAEAETCPMAYKCMCRTKSFPVP